MLTLILILIYLGNQITRADLEQMKTVKWSTASSPAAPEARGVMRSATSITDISSTTNRIIVGYDDGTVRSFNGIIIIITDIHSLLLKSIIITIIINHHYY